MTRSRALLVLAASGLLAPTLLGCGDGPEPTPWPTPGPTPGPTPLFSEEGLSRGLEFQSPSFAVAMADVDGDGDTDAFITNPLGNNCLYLNKGAGFFTEDCDSVADPSAYSTGAVFADFNGDGRLDLFVSADEGDMNRLYMRSESGLLISKDKVASWLKVRPVTQSGSATLLGTQVRVFEAGTRKEAAARASIDGGSGFCSQNGCEAYFGLGGSNASAFDVELRCGGAWVTKESVPALGNVAPKQVLEVACDRDAGALTEALV